MLMDRKSIGVIFGAILIAISINLAVGEVISRVSASYLYIIQWLPIISGIISFGLTLGIVEIVGAGDIYSDRPDLAYWGIPLISGFLGFALYYVPIGVGMGASAQWWIFDDVSNTAIALQYLTYLLGLMILGFGILSLKSLGGFTALAGVLATLFGGAFLSDLLNFDFFSLEEQGTNGDVVHSWLWIVGIVGLILLLTSISYVMERRYE
jgi:hypothetical protein